MMDEEQDDNYSKVIGQYRLAVGKLLKPLRVYGQGFYADSVLEEFVQLGITLHMKLNGIDIPYEVKDIHW